MKYPYVVGGTETREPFSYDYDWLVSTPSHKRSQRATAQQHEIIKVRHSAEHLTVHLLQRPLRHPPHHHSLVLIRGSLIKRNDQVANEFRAEC